MPAADDTVVGLRERKKAKTRAAIQQHAMRLFAGQGYASTTVEQICEAAEVSPSTFFRYFPTKEDVAMYDATDPVILAALRRQPRELRPVAAMRRALHQAFAELPPDEMERQMQRFDLARTVPELRARMFDEFARTIDMTVAMLAERTDLAADDPHLRSLGGAIVGIVMAALLAPGDQSSVELIRRVDEALGHLEEWLPL